jgi:hypothetical protein
MRRTALLLPVLAAAVVAMLAGPAHAQATRTWVSGVGDDANPCSRTAPCKTFAGAISKTAAGGEINVLDPGGFGGVTITKSITIKSYVEAGVLVSGTNGILVNAGASDVVILRGLDIQGVGTGLAGVKFLAGAALHVEACEINGFKAGSSNGWGIQFVPSGSAELYVSDTQITNNGDASSGGGILVQAGTGATSKVILNRVEVYNNFFGIKADGRATGGGTINMTIRDSTSAGNQANGIVGTMSGTGAAVVMMVDQTASSHNAAFGVIADGASTTIRIGGSSITGNATGVGASNSATLRSYKNNQIDGNTADGTPVTQVNLN